MDLFLWLGIMTQSADMVDVLVIGAGPVEAQRLFTPQEPGFQRLSSSRSRSGNACSLRRMLESLAVDNSTSTSDHVKALDVKGIRVIFPDGTEKLLTEKGYVLEKHLFERWLCDEAVKKGAKLHLHHRVNSMKRIMNSENEFSYWEIDGRGDEFPIQCKAV